VRAIRNDIRARVEALIAQEVAAWLEPQTLRSSASELLRPEFFSLAPIVTPSSYPFAVIRLREYRNGCLPPPRIGSTSCSGPLPIRFAAPAKSDSRR
jgi:hypothetical protein